MPSLRQLQYFAALADCRNYRQAAEACGVSQPTLSAQLSALEERLGVELVERGRSPVILTPAGEDIRVTARRILGLVQDMRDTAQKYRRQMSGVVRLGLPASIGPYLLPHVVSLLHSAYPDLRLYVREAIPDALPEALARGVHDIIIAPLPVRGDGLQVLPLFREPLYLAVPADHPFAARQDVTFKDLAGQPMLTLEKGHALHEQVVALCQDCGARLLDDYEGTSLDTLRQMTAMGSGLTFLPGLYVKRAADGDPGIVTMALKGRDISRTIGLAWRAASPAEEAFRSIATHVRAAVKQQFPGFMILEG
jgi:LysR family hydrogen peroxide-inducible transcriptional activator